MSEAAKKDKSNNIFTAQIDWEKVASVLFSDLAKSILLCIIMVSFPLVELYSEITHRTYMFQDSLLQGVGILLCIYLFVDFKRRKSHRLVWSDVFILLSILFSVISIIFSMDPYESLTGYEDFTAEGPGQVLGFYMVFLLASSIDNAQYKNNILYAFFAVCLFHTIPAIMQRFDVWPYESFRHREVAGSYGLTQHFNYFAPLAIMFSAMSSILYIKKDAKAKAFWYVSSMILFIVALYSWCRIAWVGLIVYVFFIIFFEIYQKIKGMESVVDTRRFIVVFLTYITIFVFMAFFSEVVSSQFLETTMELQGEARKIGNNRGYIWYVGLYAVKDHLFTGLGFDNYRRAFWLYPDWHRVWYAYRGHCEYIHMLVTQGIFSAINYIAICVYSFFFGIKQYLVDERYEKNRWLIYMFLCMIIGYFAQACFNDSACNVAVYRWMIIGLLVPRCRQKILWKSKEKEMV